jgi:hypothetical protein
MPTRRTSNAPRNAPPSISQTEAARRTPRLRLSTPAPASEASPVSVIVRTVVVTSGIRSKRAPVFWIPIAVPRSPIREYWVTVSTVPAETTATATAAAKKATCAVANARTRWNDASRDDDRSRPATNPAARKTARAASEAGAERPWTPANANPRNTTLPVMFATNTWPSAR